MSGIDDMHHGVVPARISHDDAEEYVELPWAASGSTGLTECWRCNAGARGRERAWYSSKLTMASSKHAFLAAW